MTDTQPESLPEFSVRLIRLEDGTLIDPLTREPINKGSSMSGEKSHGRAVLTNSNSNDSEEEEIEEDEDLSDISLSLVPIARRSFHDITLPRKQMAVICMAIMYKNWGLPDDEIATAIGISIDSLNHIRNLDMYSRLDNDLVESLRASYMNSTEGILQQASTKAALKMVRLIGDKSKDLGLAASKDILDRTGHRPADKIEHSIRMEQDLTIRIISDEEEDAHFKTIDLEVN